jgi:dihydrofolate synthase/folylpolyglutamate synthase
MSYQAAIEELNALAQELHTKPGQPRRKFSLEEFRVLLTALGEPQKRFRSVLIAGTNGKGSTASTLASILSASGIRTGLYTSPHLERANERIRIGKAEIGETDFGCIFFHIYEIAKKLVRDGGLRQLPSFFEILTALAAVYFAESEVEIAVLEVGMGGRLDATNVVDPLVSVITDISLDHTEWLGPTLSAITCEKAGILRRGGTLITLSQEPEVNKTLEQIIQELGVRVIPGVEFLPRNQVKYNGFYDIDVMGVPIEVASPLRGTHQQRNIALAIATAVELGKSHGFPVTASTIREGIRLTYWPGRLERIETGGVEWILDVAHNPAGALALRTGLSAFLHGEGPRLFIFSCLRDKPVKALAQILFPLFDEVIFAPIHSVRAVAMEELERVGREAGIKATSAISVAEALRWARERAYGGTVVVSGSVYLVGEARSLLMVGGIE